MNCLLIIILIAWSRYLLWAVLIWGSLKTDLFQIFILYIPSFKIISNPRNPNVNKKPQKIYNYMLLQSYLKLFWFLLKRLFLFHIVSNLINC